MEQFRAYIQEFVHFPDEEFEDIQQHFKEEILLKRRFFHQAGEVCNRVAYIREGALRSYYKLDMTEFTRFVLMRGQFATALTSFVTQKPARENIQALTDCRLYTLDYETNEMLYAKYPKWQELGRKLIAYYHQKLEERVFRLLTQSAEERYRALTEEQPELLQEVPLQYIASILGVTRETLSRIRRKISR